MNCNVPQEYQIIDRKCAKGKTISGYTKNEVIKHLLESIDNKLINDANFWGAELISSGDHSQIWDALLSYYFEFINYPNPHLLGYLAQQYALYINIKKLYTGNLKNLCNNQEFRNHLSDTISLLCLSEKNQIIIPSCNHNYAKRSREDPQLHEKTNKFIEIFLKNISNNSTLY